MDRSVIDTWRAEERDLSDILHKKLEILMVIHPPSEEFRKIFTEDMFLKPNPKGFFHVMHYLFLLLDPAEFKKRFYWPISDKKSEAFFRTSTVEYLNYLNEKHHLNWKQLTNYLVVMPGGVKFITFLMDIIDFIITELIKRTEKIVFNQSGKENRENKKITLEKLKQEDTIFTTHASRYAEEIDAATALVMTNTSCLKLKLDEMAKYLGISVEKLMDPNFLQQWENMNWKMFQCEFKNKSQNLNDLSDPLNELKKKTELILNRKSEISYDKDSLLRSYDFIQNTNPSNDEQQVLFPKNQLSFAVLVKAFNVILPKVDKTLSGIQQTNIDKWDLESNEIEKLTQDLTELKMDMLKFSNSLADAKACEVRETPMHTKPSLENCLRDKFINTPPIAFDIDQTKVKKTRLPFLDDDISQGDSFSFANQTTLLHPRSTKTDPNRSAEKNKPKLFNPLTILRTVKKSSHNHKSGNGNLSVLASKWKERALLLDSESSIQIEEIEETQNILKPSTRYNEIKQTKNMLMDRAIETQAILSPDGITYQKRNKGSSLAVNGFDFLKVSTSPSGRLESLVKLDNFNIPPEFLNGNAIVKKSTEKVSDEPAASNQID